MTLENYKELLRDLNNHEDFYVYSFRTVSGEYVRGKIIGMKSPTVFFGDVESGGEPTLLSIELLKNGNEPTEEQVDLSVVDIDSYIVFKKAYKPNSNF